VCGAVVAEQKEANSSSLERTVSNEELSHRLDYVYCSTQFLKAGVLYSIVWLILVIYFL
jgi:hypothetical protein